MPINATASSGGSKKRRRGDDARVTKFYAVRVGMRPGVYETWKECYLQIDKFKGACYKAFWTFKDAQDFVAGKNVENKSDSTQTKKFYGVAVGHNPGVYTDWTEASLQIKDIRRPKFKKFATHAEAEFFVMTKGKELEEVLEQNATEDEDRENLFGMEEEEEEEEKEEEEEDEEENFVVEGDEVNSPLKKMRKLSKLSQSSKSKELDETIKVYTDGSARGNGKVGARAGVGVFFGTNDPRNVSEPLQGEMQTNQRAELTAVLRALERCPEEKDVQIFTDNIYSINCLTKWYKSWLKNKWRTSTGSTVVNKDLIQAARLIIDHRNTFGAKTDLIWVRAHNHNFGNEAADRLAVASAMAPREI